MKMLEDEDEEYKELLLHPSNETTKISFKRYYYDLTCPMISK